MRKILFILAATVLTLCGCSDDDANFNLGTPAASGTNCLVEELVLNDTLKAIVDIPKRLLKVKVPVDFTTAKRNMKITKLSISAGAQCDIKQGDNINLDAPQVVTVKNGDIVMKYKLAVINDEAKIYNFILEGKKGIINQDDKTITVSVAANEGIDLSSATFDVVASEDATCTPMSGSKGNFTEPFEIVVKDRSAYAKYTVVVKLITAPVAIIVGDATNSEEIESIEEKMAARGFTSAIPNSMYVSWDDLVNASLDGNNLEDGQLDLSKCRMIYFHRHCFPYTNYKDFMETETKAMEAVKMVKKLWNSGVGIFLSRAAVNYAIALGAQPEDAYPNNVFGSAPDEGADKMGDDPWHFYSNQPEHPLWANLKKGPDPNGIYTLDPGYTICNTSSQIGFWDAYAGGIAAVEEKTGGRVLADNGDACQAWELKAANGEYGKGGIICMGTGLFDWNSPSAYTSNLHDNVGQIMINALDYIGK